MKRSLPLRRASILLVTAAAVPASAGDARGAGDRVRHADFWSIGYAVQVAQSCPQWVVERQEVLAERGVLPRSDPRSGMLRTSKPDDRERLRGQNEAIADARRHGGFCRDVRAMAGPRWARLSRALRPRRDDDR